MSNDDFNETNVNETMLNEKRLLDKVAKLPQEISPDRDLWQGIERAITTVSSEKQSSNIVSFTAKAPLAWAATIVVAILFSWMNFTPQQTLESKTDIAAAMQQSFEQQKQLMLVSLGQPDIDKLSTDMQAQFTQLSSAQVAIKKALENDPDNASLLNLLRWTQQQELNLLNQLYRPKWQSI